MKKVSLLGFVLASVLLFGTSVFAETTGRGGGMGVGAGTAGTTGYTGYTNPVGTMAATTNRGNWGWIGLVGLAGLAGLMGRQRNDNPQR